ncbi:MAG: PadR family transcriptional regulator, regulatory protein PadR [Blastocatellia bacterium]|nr:PadR family transcriptional regulator, regulatory protein PadR [Blastocatellia bacterium]
MGILSSYWMARGKMKIQKTDLLQGTLELLVLRLLRSGQLNGWDIMQRIQLITGEVLSVTPGALYPALHRLEERGQISSTWGLSENNRKAKFYSLTPAGRKQLEAEREEWKRFSGAVDLLLRDA